ncbi:MAG: phosphotransferase [Alkalimonas sp.]|nr:phosphotransferase [Alkalimonas sp.]
MKHWFTGFTRYDEAGIRKLAERKQWLNAHKVLQKHPLPLGWLTRHIAHLAELQTELNKVASRQQSQLRLRGFGWSLQSSQPVFLGVVCAGAFRHQVIDRNQAISTVFEKVESRKRKRSIQQQLTLFQHFTAKQLLAPEYFGSISHGHFISLIYQCIDGTHPSDEDMSGCVHRLVQHFWGVPVPKTLQASAKKQEFLSKFFSVEKLRRYLDKAEDNTQREALQWLQDQRKGLVHCYRRLPAVVMHDDISSGNILIDPHDGLWLVDWDKWSLNRVGAGLRILPSQIFQHEVSATIQWYCRYNTSCTEDMLRFNICLYNLIINIKQGAPSSWLAWYDLCRKYYEDGSTSNLRAF